MTKVDETAVVPPVDAAARERLALALDIKGVVAAYLFGSQATGKAGQLSDVDVAVWADPEFDRGPSLSWQLRLMRLASEALHTGEVDVVVLNDTPPLLCHRAIRGGVRILERDKDARVRLETSALLQYLDTKPLRTRQAAARRARIAGGNFGRR